MSKTYRVNDFFNTTVESNSNGDQRLLLHHMEGCQTLDFGETTVFPRQTEVLTALKVLGVDLSEVYGLQFGGKNKYTLYSKTYKPILQQNEISISGQTVKISLTTPIIREIEPRYMDVFISGLPLEVSSEVLIDKLRTVHKIDVKTVKNAVCYGHDQVNNGERILKVPKNELKKVPTYFYVLGFLVRTWYKGCELDRPCPRCKKIGHTPKNCTAILSTTCSKDSYASALTGTIPGEVEEEIEVVQVILPLEDSYETPKKTTKKIVPSTPIKTSNKYAFLPIEEVEEVEESEGIDHDMSGIQPFTSTPIPVQKSPIPAARKRKSKNLSASSSSEDSDFPPLQEVLGGKKPEKVDAKQRKRNQERREKILKERIKQLDLSSTDSEPKSLENGNNDNGNNDPVTLDENDKTETIQTDEGPMPPKLVEENITMLI